MASKSKTKGKGFEREVAKYLSDLYGESFTRSITSGAMIGGKNNIRKSTLSEGQIQSYKGDIVPPDDWKKFNCECKNYSAFPFHKLFSSETISDLENFIDQTMEVADEGDVNIIFMKFDYIGRYVAYQLPQDFVSNKYIDYDSKKWGKWRFTKFEDFFDSNKENFEKSCKNT
jgi:hypothetical protein